MRALVLILSFISLNAMADNVAQTAITGKAKIADSEVREFQSQVENIRLSSAGGAYITACDAKTGACVKGKLPKALGKITKIVHGKFAERTTASWFALTPKRTYMCAFAHASTRIHCASLGKVKMPGIDVDFIEAVAERRNVLSFRTAPQGSKPVFYAHTITFLREYQETQARLQNKVDGATAGRMMTMSATDSTCDPDGSDDWGDETPPPPEDEGDEVWPDEQGFSVDEMQVVQIVGHVPAGTDSVPTGWTCTPGGFVITCTNSPPIYDPELPQPTPQPVFSWCSVFGLFCSMTKTTEEKLAACADKWGQDQNYCSSMSKIMGKRWFDSCWEDARLDYLECREKAYQ